MKPYDAPGEWTTVSRQERNQRKRNKLRIRQLIDFESNLEENSYFVNVFNVNFPGILYIKGTKLDKGKQRKQIANQEN